MCGIAGIAKIDAAAPVSKHLLERLCEPMISRGPDDEGYFVGNGVGLGARRLSIIDLQGGHQPVSNETGDVYVVQNGEIYNYRQLREDLLARGHTFRTRCDTEVLVHLYEEQGDEMVNSLRGMFAIAVWDDSKRRLLLARDRAGIKPLFYSTLSDGLAFGSTLSALSAHPEISKDICPSSLTDYLRYGTVPSPRTLFRSMQCLPPGHLLVFQNGHLDIRRYWQLDYQPKVSLSFEEACEQLRALLTESVRLHLESDVPVGTLLSGGMDSSTIVAAQSWANAGTIKTFSVGFPDNRYNELPLARKIADRFNTDHHELMVGPNQLEMLGAIISGFDQPLGDSSALPTFLLCCEIRQHVKVALSGDGGDEFLAGYPRYKVLKMNLLLRRLSGPLHGALPRNSVEENKSHDAGLLDRIQRVLSDLGRDPKGIYQRHIRVWTDPLLERIGWDKGLWQEREESWNSIYDQDNATHPLDKMLMTDFGFYLPEDLLVKMDRMSMANSLEVRVPLLDHRLVEFFAKLPVDYKLRFFTSKYLLRKTMQGTLPKEILQGRKRGFAIPVHDWCRTHLAETLRARLPNSDSVASRFCDTKALAGLLHSHFNGSENLGHPLWTLLMLEMWHQA